MQVSEKGFLFEHIPTQPTDVLRLAYPCLDLPSWKFNDVTVHDRRDTNAFILTAKENLLERYEQLGIHKDPKILLAMAIAEEGHADDYRKASGKPYFGHPLDVAYVLSCVEVVGRDPDAQATALTHDLAEDSEITIAQLRKELGDTVADNNALLTADEPPGKKPRPKTLAYLRYWQVKKLTALNKALSNQTTSIIKTGDFLSNTYDFLCDRKLLDANGQVLGKSVFDKFSVDEPAILERSTHAARRIFEIYKENYSQTNPLSLPLMETAILLINDCCREELADTESPWSLEPLYRDLIKDLEGTKTRVISNRFHHR